MISITSGRGEDREEGHRRHGLGCLLDDAGRHIDVVLQSHDHNELHHCHDCHGDRQKGYKSVDVVSLAGKPAALMAPETAAAFAESSELSLVDAALLSPKGFGIISACTYMAMHATIISSMTTKIVNHTKTIAQ